LGRAKNSVSSRIVADTGVTKKNLKLQVEGKNAGKGAEIRGFGSTRRTLRRRGFLHFEKLKKAS